MHVIDIIVLIATLAVVVLVGYLSSKKTKDAKEFLTAGRSLNKLQAGFSLAATDFGGSGLVAAIGYCYLMGLGGMWWDLAAAPAFIFVGLFLARKLNRLEGGTVPEYLGQRYCPAAKYISAAMHICTDIASLSAQFTISSAMLEQVAGVDHTAALLISLVLTVLLTSGGLRAVVNTDATLFLVIVSSVVICVPVALHAGGGLANMAGALPEGFLSPGSIGFVEPLSWFFMCTLGYATSQGYVQRMSSAKDEGTATFAAFFTAGFYLVISICLGLIGVAAAYLMPGVEDTNTVFPKLLMEYFPKGLLGLSVAGVFAATISTGTSKLHATTILLISDLIKPLSKDKLNGKAELILSRVVVCILPFASLLLSVYSTNIIRVLYTAGLFYSTAVFAPMFVGMYFKRPTAAGGVAAILGTTAFALAWEYLLSGLIPVLGKIPSNLMGVVFGAAILFAASAIDRKKHLQNI